jgi:prophage antirepressor-like protein
MAGTSSCAVAPTLSFHTTAFNVVDHHGQRCLRASEIGLALGYADDKAVQRIYTRHSDEFTGAMTGVVKLTTPSGKQDARVFSLRGAHLLAMFARTPTAKEFRRWVLDILDREVANPSRPSRAGITAAQAKSAQAQLEVMRKQLAKVEAHMAEWVVVDDTPPPQPALHALVNEVGRYKDGSWGLYVTCGEVRFSLQVDNAVMRAGGVKAGDRVRIEYERGNALSGPYTRVCLQSEYQDAMH